MKKAVALILLSICLFSFAHFSYAHAEITSSSDTLMSKNDVPLYRGRSVGATSIFKTRDNTSPIKSYGKYTWFDIYDIDPCFVTVKKDDIVGYVYRSRLEQVEPLNATTTPPYGVILHNYVGTIKEDAPILKAPKEDAETFITLHQNARVAFVGFEQGYAKVIYHREYAYINSNHFKDFVRVNSSPDDVLNAPLCAFTSYYKIVQTEANIGRMKNLGVACEKLSKITLQPGDVLNFNKHIGPYRKSNGYFVAPVLSNGKLKLNYGGGTCQVSSTLYNAVLELPGLTVLKRRAHGANGASYLPHGVDAAVGSDTLNFIFRNDYTFPVKMDCSAQDGALYVSFWQAK